MFGTIAKAALLTAIAVGSVVGLLPPADPAPYSGSAAAAIDPAGNRLAALADSSFRCVDGSGALYIGLPYEGATRMSLFAYRVDSGPWQYTNWYLTGGGKFYMHEGGQWSTVPSGQSYFYHVIGSGHTVTGWEYRYDTGSRTAGWISLGTCSTTSFWDGIPITGTASLEQGVPALAGWKQP